MLQRLFDAGRVLTGRARLTDTRGRIMANVGGENQYRYPALNEVKEQQQQYIDSALIYIAVSRIARYAGTVEFSVMRKTESATPGEMDKVRVVNHWLEKLLRTPNAWMSRFELIEATFGFLFLAGNSFWYMNGRDEIIPLRPDRIRIVAGPDTKTYVRGYVYTVNSVDIPLLPQDVIHFKFFHPLDDFYGLSPIRPGAVAVQSDQYMARYNRGYFGKNNGVPPNMVSIDPTVTDSEYERLQEDWFRNYNTAAKEQKTAFIRGGSVTYTDFAKSQKDMDFIAGRKYNKEEVMLIYGIPPGILDVNATEANALAGKEVFIDQTLWPNLVMFTQKLTSALTSAEDLEVEPADIRVKNAAAELREMQAASTIMSTDELRARYFDMSPATWEGHDKPPVGADAMVPSAGFGKPNLSKSPEQIASADKMAGKGIETDEQRKWFFANNPQMGSGGGGHPKLQEGFSYGKTIAPHELQKGDNFYHPGNSRHGSFDGTVTKVNPRRVKLATSSWGHPVELDQSHQDLHGGYAQRGNVVHPIAYGFGGMKALLPDLIEVPRIQRTGPMRHELQQFQRYMGKGKSADRFTFQQNPASIEIAYKAIADINELGLLTLKAVLPASARISVNGVRDPNGSEKEQSAQALSDGFGEGFTDLQNSLVAGIQHVAAEEKQPYLDHFDNRWWKQALAALVATMYGVFHDQVDSAIADCADVTAVREGRSYDPASVAPLAVQAADQWTADWLPGITATTRAAFEAMLTRWASANAPQIDDLISACQESPAFGEDRAAMCGETENTRLWGAALVLGGMMVMGSDYEGVNLDDAWELIPAHAGCVCFGDDDQVWHTLKDGHNVCPLCEGRDGKTFSGILDGGL